MDGDGCEGSRGIPAKVPRVCPRDRRAAVAEERAAVDRTGFTGPKSWTQ